MWLRLAPVLLLISLAAGLYASGPYSPPRATPQQTDEAYELGKAIYWGGMSIGQGSTCASCHTGQETLSKARLKKIKYNLQNQITNCAKQGDRVNGSVDDKQMEALVQYLAKRFHM